LADQRVEIENVGGNGVASEATLQSLLKAFDRLAKNQGADARKAKDLAEKYNAEVRKGIKVVTENRDALANQTDALEDATRATTSFGRGLTGLLVSGISTLAGSAFNLAKEFAFGGNQLGDFTQHIPIIGDLISPFANMLDNSVESFRSMSSVGASFNNSITDMRLAAANAELNLDEFQSFVGANAQSLRLLGGTVTEGVQRFTNINKAIKASGDLEVLRNLGFTIEEVNEGLADYTALQSRLGMLEGQSNAQLAAGSANYLKRLDALAKITGQQRDQIAQSIQQNAADASFRAIAKSLESQFGPDSEQLRNFTDSMALIDSIGGSTAIALKDLADGVPQTEEAIALVNAAGPEIMEAMKAVAAGSDPKVLQDALNAAGKSIDGFAGEGGDAAAFISAIRESNPALAAILDESYKLREVGSQNYDAALEEQKKRDAITAELVIFEDKVREVRATLATAFIESGVFDTVATAFTDIAALFTQEPFKTELKDTITGFADEIKELLTGETTIGEKIGEGFKSLLTSETVLTGAGVAIAALFGASVIKNAITNGFGKMFDSMTGGGGGGGGGGRRGRAGGGLAGQGRQIGAFVGNLGGGVMAGAAKGLQAFGGPQSPMILAGAATLAGVITAIGAGIAGAAWLTGLAFPTFIDGMKQFETLDSEALSSAAGALSAMSGAMAKFGAGTAVAGAGSVIGAIGGAISGLFGSDSPMDQLIAFGEAGINTQGVERNAEAMVNMATALKGFSGINDLDTSNISSYNDAIKELVETLEALNDVLSETNGRGRGRSAMNASDLLERIGGSTAGSSAALSTLNSTMEQVLSVLRESRDFEAQTLTATKSLNGNLIQGGI
jgi:DNA-binding transcriptional MerR regulator